MTDLTIIMYHYVRPIVGSKFPSIKGLELEGFKRQLDYLESHFEIVSSEQVIDAIVRNRPLPKDACWLTFDDGFKDHYQYVLPEFKARNISGAFFPPRVVIQDAMICNVHAIQHILSCTKNISELIVDLNELCRLAGINDDSINTYYKEYHVASRFDNAETIYVKRLLQHALPEDVRNAITSSLFEKYVGVSEAEFSSQLYMNADEIRELINSGMYVGSHGSMHYWLNKISAEKQKVDISHSLEFLEEIGAPTTDWVMCYPYGGYNCETLSILKELGAAIGLMIKYRVAKLGVDNPLTLPRLDTNDFPQ